jgi:hypothetical protein
VQRVQRLQRRRLLRVEPLRFTGVALRGRFFRPSMHLVQVSAAYIHGCRQRHLAQESPTLIWASMALFSAFANGGRNLVVDDSRSTAPCSAKEAGEVRVWTAVARIPLTRHP